MVVGPMVWGISPESAGTGLGALTYAMRHVGTVGRPVGGSGHGAGDAAPRVRGLGGDGAHVDTGWPRSTCEGDAVRGVVLDDGTEITAPVVVSACNPHDTFVEWLRNPPPQADGARRPVAGEPAGRRLRVEDRRDARPSRRSCAALGDTPLAIGATLVVAPSLADIDRGYAMMAPRRGAPPARDVRQRAVAASTRRWRRPAGTCSASRCCTRRTAIRGGWASSAEPHRWLEQFAALAEPGFLESIGEWRAMTPEAYEREFHLPAGHATSFAGGPLAALRNKDPELTRYETAVRGCTSPARPRSPAPASGVPAAQLRHVVLAHRDDVASAAQPHAPPQHPPPTPAGAGLRGAGAPNIDSTARCRRASGRSQSVGLGAVRSARRTCDTVSYSARASVVDGAQASHGAAVGHRLLVAPREVDPLVGALPDVVALHDGVGLLVEHRGAHLGDLALAELLHAAQRVAGVGDVVGDQDAGVATRRRSRAPAAGCAAPRGARRRRCRTRRSSCRRSSPTGRSRGRRRSAGRRGRSTGSCPARSRRRPSGRRRATPPEHLPRHDLALGGGVVGHAADATDSRPTRRTRPHPPPEDFHKQNRADARFRAPESLQARCSRFLAAKSCRTLENACGNQRPAMSDGRTGTRVIGRRGVSPSAWRRASRIAATIAGVDRDARRLADALGAERRLRVGFLDQRGHDGRACRASSAAGSR